MQANPFILPEGNIQICFSGGRSSAMMLHNILEANGNLPDRVKVIFTNTGREFPATLDFVNACASRWGIDVIWLEYDRIDNKVGYKTVSHNEASRDGKPFEKLVQSRGYLPNVVARFCTAELKVRTAKRYLVQHGWKNWTSAIGIRADEPHRLKNKKPRERWVNWYPLEDAVIAKGDVQRFWEAQAFDLNLPNINGRCPLGNCDLCFLKSEATIAGTIRDYPNRADWWEQQEAAIGSTFHKSRSVKSLRRHVEKQGDFLFSNDALLCQQAEGECVI